MDAFRHSDVNWFVEKNAEDEAYHSGKKFITLIQV